MELVKALARGLAWTALYLAIVIGYALVVAWAGCPAP